jgi:hypothetical protein
LTDTRGTLELRSRLIAWLVTSGVEPLSIVSQEDQETFRALLRSRVPALGHNVPERAARALASIVGLLSQAAAVFAPTLHGVNPQDAVDVQLLIAYLLNHLDDASEQYGWTDASLAPKQPATKQSATKQSATKAATAKNPK